MPYKILPEAVLFVATHTANHANDFLRIDLTYRFSDPYSAIIHPNFDARDF